MEMDNAHTYKAHSALLLIIPVLVLPNVFGQFGVPQDPLAKEETQNWGVVGLET